VGNIRSAKKKADQAMRGYREMTSHVLLQGLIKNVENQLKQARSKMSKDTYKTAKRELEALKKSVRNAKKQKFSIAEYEADIFAKMEGILSLFEPGAIQRPLIMEVWWEGTKAPPQTQATSGEEISYHEQLLERRMASVQRVRNVVRKTAQEISEVEKKLGRERNQEERKQLQVLLENARMRLLRRTILMQRTELKRVEMAEYVQALKETKERGLPPPPGQLRQQRLAALTRRLERAENLLNIIKGYSKSAISDREQAQISRLTREQEKVISDLKGRIAKLR
jgi:hypothetical protein